MTVTAGGQTVKVPMYYTSATQVSGLLPSNTPVGAGTLTVSYNGQAGNAQPINVVQNNLGIFTVSENGQGVGIVTYADYSYVTSTKAANPGDTLILWATGLGPVSGNDLSPSVLGVNMPNIPLTLWLGGVQAPVTYQGRSGCCAGEDQIVFTVPANVPTGCAVPLMVQIGNTSQIGSNTVMISNNTVMAVASGSRTCTPSNPILSPNAVQQLTSGTPAAFGLVGLARNISALTNNGSGLIYEDDGTAQFGAYTVAASDQPFVTSYFDTLPVGTCLVYNTPYGKAAPAYLGVTGLDAGLITVNGPTGPLNMLEKQNSGQVTQYFVDLSPLPGSPYLSRGTYTITGAGGRDVGKFSASLTIGSIPAWTNQSSFITKGIFTVTRANGATLTWPSTSSLAYIEIDGTSYTDGNFSNAALFSCIADASAGTFTVPPPVLAALPASPYFELEFKPVLSPVAYSASGLSLGSVSITYLTAVSGTLQ